jgi:formylmethanofuran dehydrogenase subunit E
MEQLNDHPAIRAAERYGYPEPPKVAAQCSECEEPIYEGEAAFRFSFGWICEHCADRAYQTAEV